MRMNKKSIALLIIALALFAGVGYGVGFANGSYYSLVWVLGFADEFIDTLTFDEEMIAAGLLSYKDRVNNCFVNPMTNLTI